MYLNESHTNIVIASFERDSSVEEHYVWAEAIYVSSPTIGELYRWRSKEISRKDLFHFAVRRALEKDGWTITHDPLRLKVGTLKLEADIGSDKLIAAQKDNLKIAVEVKSFLHYFKNHGVIPCHRAVFPL